MSFGRDQFCEKREDLHIEFPLLQDYESFVTFLKLELLVIWMLV